MKEVEKKERDSTRCKKEKKVYVSLPFGNQAKVLLQIHRPVLNLRCLNLCRGRIITTAAGEQQTAEQSRADDTHSLIPVRSTSLYLTIITL